MHELSDCTPTTFSNPTKESYSHRFSIYVLRISLAAREYAGQNTWHHIDKIVYATSGHLFDSLHFRRIINTTKSSLRSIHIRFDPGTAETARIDSLLRSFLFLLEPASPQLREIDIRSFRTSYKSNDSLADDAKQFFEQLEPSLLTTLICDNPNTTFALCKVLERKCKNLRHVGLCVSYSDAPRALSAISSNTGKLERLELFINEPLPSLTPDLIEVVRANKETLRCLCLDIAPKRVEQYLQHLLFPKDNVISLDNLYGALRGPEGSRAFGIQTPWMLRINGNSILELFARKGFLPPFELFKEDFERLEERNSHLISLDSHSVIGGVVWCFYSCVTELDKYLQHFTWVIERMKEAPVTATEDELILNVLFCFSLFKQQPVTGELKEMLEEVKRMVIYRIRNPIHAVGLLWEPHRDVVADLLEGYNGLTFKKPEEPVVVRDAQGNPALSRTELIWFISANVIVLAILVSMFYASS
jgi:hypothetical protein